MPNAWNLENFRAYDVLVKDLGGKQPTLYKSSITPKDFKYISIYLQVSVCLILYPINFSLQKMVTITEKYYHSNTEL